MCEEDLSRLVPLFRDCNRTRSVLPREGNRVWRIMDAIMEKLRSTEFIGSSVVVEWYDPKEILENGHRLIRKNERRELQPKIEDMTIQQMLDNLDNFEGDEVDAILAKLLPKNGRNKEQNENEEEKVEIYSDDTDDDDADLEFIAKSMSVEAKNAKGIVSGVSWTRSWRS